MTTNSNGRNSAQQSTANPTEHHTKLPFDLAPRPIRDEIVAEQQADADDASLEAQHADEYDTLLVDGKPTEAVYASLEVVRQRRKKRANRIVLLTKHQRREEAVALPRDLQSAQRNSAATTAVIEKANEHHRGLMRAVADSEETIAAARRDAEVANGIAWRISDQIRRHAEANPDIYAFDPDTSLQKYQETMEAL
jgi:hypothetical protein